MSQLKMLCVVAYVVIGTFPVWGAEDMVIEDKENCSPNSRVSRKADVPMKDITKITTMINHIAKEIKEAHEEADAKKIREVYGAFKKLKFESEVWEALGRLCSAGYESGLF